IQFFSQSHFVPLRFIQGGAQKSTELSDHAVGKVGIFVDKFRKSIQAVEEKVRIELHAQGFQTSVLPLCFQLGSLQFASAELPVIIECIHHADNGRVDEHVPVKVDDEAKLEQRPPLACAARVEFEQPIKAGPQRDIGEGHDHSAGRVEQ